MATRYNTLEEMVGLFDEPNSAQILRFLHDNKEQLRASYGSVHNHQSWPGGWWDHTTEVMNIAISLYTLMDALRPLPFTLSEALLVLFMHDIEKPWKYEDRGGELFHKRSMNTKDAHHRARLELAEVWEINLSPEVENGIRYAEGELEDYSNRERIMHPLAAFAHMCDVASARIWHDCPREHRDEWQGARRLHSAHIKQPKIS
ncbi:MAG: hypothetical protein AAB421_00055 [Patescibacteria group bacterium]